MVKLISFIRNSISSRAGSAKAQQQKNECLNALHDNTSVYQLKPLAHLGLIPATLNNKAGETVIGTTNIKTSVMRTFIRKSGVFAIILLIANLFLLSNSIGQTTQTFNATSTSTIPAGVTAFTVQAWGGGGAGGGNTNTSDGAGGGGGGSYSRSVLTLSPGTYTVTVGTGGNGGTGTGGSGRNIMV